MRTIYKYLVPIEDSFIIPLPPGSKVLQFALQGDEPMIWVEVEPSPQGLEARTFHIVGTGRKIPTSSEYVGTVQMDGYVWHLYEH
jgi:hypothetical protein